MILLEQIINGMGQGLIYAMVTMGYALIFSVVGLVNFTHGDVTMIGAFSAYYVFSFGVRNIFVAMLCGFLVSGLTGFFVHRICYNRFFDSPRQISLICTIALSIFFRNLVQIVCGSEAKGVPTVLGYESLSLMGISIAHSQLFILGTILVLCLVLTFFLNKTRMGLSLRAVSMDKKAAALVGIDTKFATTLGTVLGSAIGGVAGVLYAVYYGSVTAYMGATIGLKAFISSVMSGMSSIAGAAVSAWMIGIAENLGIMVFSANFREVVGFLFLIIVLMIKPEGLFVRKGK